MYKACPESKDTKVLNMYNIFNLQKRHAVNELPILTYLLTYLLTPWSRVLLEKLTGSAASQEIPRIFGTRRFITVPTSARHLSLSWANSIQSSQPPPTSWRSIFIYTLAHTQAHTCTARTHTSTHMHAHMHKHTHMHTHAHASTHARTRRLIRTYTR